MKAFVGTSVNASRFRIWTVLITRCSSYATLISNSPSAHQLFTTVTSWCMIGGPIAQPIPCAGDNSLSPLRRCASAKAASMV